MAGQVVYSPHVAEGGAASIATLPDGAPLACVIARTESGPIANHLPLLRAPNAALIGHVALGNEMHRLIRPDQEVLAVFRRDDACVPPGFYPTGQEHHRHVPIWHYEVEHICGTVSVQHEDHAKRAAVGLLTCNQERRLNGENARRMADAPADYPEQMLPGIVAFRMSPTRGLAKSKLSQNRETGDCLGMVEGQPARAGIIAAVLARSGLAASGALRKR
ncbi:FMN-binding negative transcriptional regulator [Pseudogemmobacter bohemicus]|uniref:FMN-binding negative transcriptional regulator n=1 Tax=Pseudogemmobacter bohemicus TaxID=2250708 RepID=UPI000DD3873B|nr:FMN-binding negative transcriptional regulator [Pseudogemmobacter bohemicus]